MSVLADHQIKAHLLDSIIEPMMNGQIKTNHREDRIISYGLSCYGYDIRCSEQWRVPNTLAYTYDNPLDPKNVDDHKWTETTSDSYVLRPSEMALTHSIEYFKVPRDVLGVCFTKSTYARCGIFVNVTPLEPEWEGTLTVEVANIGQVPVRVYANEGIAQIVFIKGDEVCDVSYKDRDGKYQGQTGITGAKV